MKSLIKIFFITIPALCFFSFQDNTGLKASISRGEDVYITYCITCHMDQGQGLEGVYPPLAKSDYLMADKARSIKIILEGASGEMKVNGKMYNLEMTGFDLTNEEAADVMNYIRNSWGNKGEIIKPSEIQANRKK